MGETSAIEWTDATWNPVTGCTKVSPGCDHCYAEGIAERFRGGDAFPQGFDLTLRPKRLAEPFKWREPKRVFVNSMSDLFHEAIPDAYIAQVFAVMALTPQHTYQVLTKRHGRLRSLLGDDEFRSLVSAEIVGYEVEDGRDAYHLNHAIPDWWPLANVWIGVSVEDQKWANIRIPALLNTPAAVRFLSCEPLLGPVYLQRALNGDPDSWRGVSALDWVIVGGESGSQARPMAREFAQMLRDECTTHRVPFFFKQWGAFNEHGERVGKHKAGRLLDGRTWDEYPAPVMQETYP